MAADKTADASTGVSTPLSQGLVAAIYGAGSGALTETGVNRLR